MTYESWKKQMMNFIVSFVLMFFLSMTLAACGGDSPPHPEPVGGSGSTENYVTYARTGNIEFDVVGFGYMLYDRPLLLSSEQTFQEEAFEGKYNPSMADLDDRDESGLTLDYEGRSEYPYEIIHNSDQYYNLAVVSDSFFRSLDYVRVYVLDDQTQFGGLMPMFVGYATDASHMPTGGSAIYRGEGIASFDLDENLRPNTNNILENDILHLDSNVEARVNFGSASFDAVLEGSGFRRNDETITASELGADSVILSGARINGNSISGGTIRAELNDVDVTSDHIGATTTSTGFIGKFFGWDDSLGAPDEVAGLGFVQGDEGFIQILFIAD